MLVHHNILPILDAITDGVLIAARDGRILFSNRALTDLLGHAREALIGQNVSVLIPSPHREQHDGYLAAFARTRTSHIVNLRREATAVHQCGEIIPIDLHVGSFNDSSEELYVGVISDISHRKAAERRLQEHAFALEVHNQELIELRQQAEQACRAKSEFLANMSHEIRTPLTAILGYADLLLHDELEGNQRSQAIETIHRSGAHLLQIISDILDLSKIEANRLEPVYGDFSLTQLIADLALMLRVKADEKHLDFAVEYHVSIPPLVHSDATLIRQILANLLGNAIKFTDQGSVRMVVSGTQRNHLFELDLQVIDTGIGISAESLSKLFAPFTQVDSSHARRSGGTGIGLTISRKLARLLGGEIVVLSQPLHGSTFQVRLPLAISDAKPVGCANETTSNKQHEPNTTQGMLQGYRLLLVEDGPDNQRLLSAILRRAGADFCLAENGQIALERVQLADATHQMYDAIIMDMQMPVMDGYAATQTLRQKGYQCPIVALTANATTADQERSLASGCNAFATKPIDRIKLLKLIRSEIERHHVCLIASSDN